MKKNHEKQNLATNPERKLRRWAWQPALRSKAGFGINEVIGIAAGIIIAVVVVIPGLQGFAGDILNNLTNWWNNMASSVFATP
jgi:hypothetical protein